jgi:hypothetical protein
MSASVRTHDPTHPNGVRVTVQSDRDDVEFADQLRVRVEPPKNGSPGFLVFEGQEGPVFTMAGRPADLQRLLFDAMRDVSAATRMDARDGELVDGRRVSRLPGRLLAKGMELIQPVGNWPIEQVDYALPGNLVIATCMNPETKDSEEIEVRWEERVPILDHRLAVRASDLHPRRYRAAAPPVRDVRHRARHSPSLAARRHGPSG